MDVNSVADALRTKGKTKLSDHAEPIEQPKPKKRPEPGRRCEGISDEDAAEFGSLMDDLRRELGGGDRVEENRQAEAQAEEARRAEAEAQRIEQEAVAKTDKQGNPIDANGKLIAMPVKSIDEITDSDFNASNRTVELPTVSNELNSIIPIDGRKVVIKKVHLKRIKESIPSCHQSNREMCLTKRSTLPT